MHEFFVCEVWEQGDPVKLIAVWRLTATDRDAARREAWLASDMLTGWLTGWRFATVRISEVTQGEWEILEEVLPGA